MKKYYKTENPEILSAWRTYATAADELTKEAKAFAAKFGATALFRRHVHGVRFGGLTFEGREPYMDRDLWTKPDVKSGGMQRPRIKVPAALREKSKELRGLYDEHCPTAEASLDPLYEVLGTNWGEIIFGSGGFNFFEHDGICFLATGVKLGSASLLHEITGTDFEEAKKARDQSKAAEA